MSVAEGSFAEASAAGMSCEGTPCAGTSCDGVMFGWTAEEDFLSAAFVWEAAAEAG